MQINFQNIAWNVPKVTLMCFKVQSNPYGLGDLRTKIAAEPFEILIDLTLSILETIVTADPHPIYLFIHVINNMP